MAYAVLQRTVGQPVREPHNADGAATLRVCAVVLTAALLVHLGMLLEPLYQATAVSSPVVAAETGADRHVGASEPAHAMVATCVAVLSLLAAVGAFAHTRGRGAVGRIRPVRGPSAGVSTRSRTAPSARGPTRINAGVVLRV